MKIYTKKGDTGDTQLIGKRVRKTNERVEAYGTLDELNSFIGLAVASLQDEKMEDLVKDLQKIQHELFDLGGDLANVSKKTGEEWAIKEEYVPYLEKRIDVYTEELTPFRAFILPGGSSAAAHLHVCRTVARRGERNILRINDEYEIPPAAVKYLNRLSDFFFTAARTVNERYGKEDILYKRNS
ncbi:cob(I)yrinic acid a,c-diamide adenosyltransferase [Evansella sp. LMS18]|uniref:cob(I)yrinic acid a,c-diamide adenosyltransferase n=1 Tax=Evansella sp. LMS18 TaxID=2924033 RepID=UPI0020D1DE5D|nr:cob(I)yrinic acid a,c-diamide adenosyltransferase [Evansella sp. LMS18]UTR09584.1 cob(I)yrinic acid a,c-diamide adenosyltransferase [Evansella sp. LMS18]